MALPRHRRSAGVTSARTVVVALVAALALAACATGPRPSFDADEPTQQATGDPAIDAVLERLDRVGLEQFTADYTILTRLGGQESTATVVQASDSRRSITINAVRFLDGTGTASTCNLTTAECEAVINDARVSDVQITHDFYGSSFARRFRVDAGRSLAPATRLHRDDRWPAGDMCRRLGVRRHQGVLRARHRPARPLRRQRRRDRTGHGEPHARRIEVRHELTTS